MNIQPISIDALGPLGTRLIIQPLEEGAQKSGLIIPDTAKQNPQSGIVLSVGPGCRELQVGDTVLYSKYGGSTIELNRTELVIISESDVLLLLEV